MRFLFDAHLDLSLNAMEWNRDLRQSVDQIRANENKLPLRQAGQGAGVVAFPEMRSGGVGLCVATQIGGCMKPRSFVANWESPAQAWAMTQAQLAWYREMESCGEMVQIKDAPSLQAHLERWKNPQAAAAQRAPIGYILSLEGADSIVSIDYLDTAWEYGLRVLGPSHYGFGRYAMGHDVQGSLPDCGRDLIRKMDDLGMILDLTHLNETCFWETLEIFSGPLWASHQNCRALVDDPRQFSDAQIKAVVERDGVIGAALDAWMIKPNFVRGQSDPSDLGISLESVADHIDHVCQLAGNACHSGIGTDLDGGFGKEQTPCDVDTIADLQSLGDILTRRGYDDDVLDAIFSGNFLRVLHRAWS